MDALEAALRQLIDDYRASCLWYLDAHYYPGSASERERVLDAIARHGDLNGFKRVAEIRAWASLPSNETSAGA